jgi:hypothetical protein
MAVGAAREIGSTKRGGELPSRSGTLRELPRIATIYTSLCGTFVDATAIIDFQHDCHIPMTHWVRFIDNAAECFGALDGATIEVYEGAMFDRPNPLGVTVDLSAVRLIAPTRPSKFIGLWNNFHALAAKAYWSGDCHGLGLDALAHSNPSKWPRASGLPRRRHDFAPLPHCESVIARDDLIARRCDRVRYLSRRAVHAARVSRRSHHRRHRYASEHVCRGQ